MANYSVSKIEESIIAFHTEYTENLDLNDTTPGIIVIDEATETTYLLLMQEGVDGKVLSYVRTVTLPDSTQYTQIIYLEIYYPTTELYDQNVVEKAGG